MSEHPPRPIKKRPLKAQLRFILNDQPSVDIPQSNPSSGNGPSNGGDPLQTERTPIPPVTGPHPSTPNAVHNLPNHHSPQCFQGSFDGLTHSTLTKSRDQDPGGNIIFNQANYNRLFQRSKASVKNTGMPLRRASPLPTSSVQHRTLSSHAPLRPISSTSHASPAKAHSQRPSPVIAGTLPPQRTHSSKRIFCSGMDTSDVHRNRQKKREGAGRGNDMPSVQRRRKVHTPFSPDEVQPNPARAYIASQLVAHAIASPMGTTNPQATDPSRMQEVRNEVHCDICNALFFNAEAVERHKISQHRNEDSLESTRWECPICRIVLKSRQNLRRHQRVHAEDANFSCPICNVRFTTERSRTTHMRDLHALATSTRGPSRNSYTCSECSYASVQKTNVKRHVDSVHRKLKRYHCPFMGCNYRASTKSNLDAHMVSYMHSSVKKEDEEETDEDTEELNLATEEGNRLERRRKDTDEGGEGGAESALPNVSLPVC